MTPEKPRTATSFVHYPDDKPDDPFPREYPYLGMHKDETHAVLFTVPKAGMVVWAIPALVDKINHPVGFIDTAWEERMYYVFDGHIEMSNNRPPLGVKESTWSSSCSDTPSPS